MGYRTLRPLISLLIVAATLALSVPAIGNAVGPKQTTFSGRAYAAYINTALTGQLYIADTGELSASGGAIPRSLLTANVPGVLSAEVLNASTSGSHGQSNSTASLAEVTVFPGTATELSAGFLRTQSRAECIGAFGTSEIVGLKFMGQTVSVSGLPNQTITVPGVATLVINEQSTTSSANYFEQRVNAIHLTVVGVGEVILASIKSDIQCVKDTTGPCFDFVTGGGTIAVAGGRANFGMNAGIKPRNKPLAAHLTYIDHATGMKVKAVGGLTYYQGSGNTRTMSGACEINGSAGHVFWLTVTDAGEPGRDDTFTLTLSNGYSAGGRLTGGNIQLHKPCDDLNPL